MQSFGIINRDIAHWYLYHLHRYKRFWMDTLNNVEIRVPSKFIEHNQNYSKLFWDFNWSQQTTKSPMQNWGDIRLNVRRMRIKRMTFSVLLLCISVNKGQNITKIMSIDGGYEFTPSSVSLWTDNFKINTASDGKIDLWLTYLLT